MGAILAHDQGNAENNFYQSRPNLFSNGAPVSRPRTEKLDSHEKHSSEANLNSHNEVGVVRRGNDHSASGNSRTNHQSCDELGHDGTDFREEDEGSLDETDLPENVQVFDDRKWSSAMQFFVRNLAYLETPQYLRKTLFKMHPFLRMAGLQNPLDAPHHMRANEWLPYRLVDCNKNELQPSSTLFFITNHYHPVS